MDADRDCDANRANPPLEEPSLDLTGQGALIFAVFASLALHALAGWLALNAGDGLPLGTRPRVMIAVRLAEPNKPPAPADAARALVTASGSAATPSVTPARTEARPTARPQPKSKPAPLVAGPAVQGGQAAPSTAPEPPSPSDSSAAHNEPVAVLPAPDIQSADGTPGRIALPGPQYVEPGLLTERPKPAAQILLEAPASLIAASNGRMVLTLLINSQGHVDDVLGDNGSLPDEIAELARATFRFALFEPGQIDGVAVNSKLRIEVTYEQIAIPPAEPSATGSTTDLDPNIANPIPVPRVPVPAGPPTAPRTRVTPPEAGNDTPVQAHPRTAPQPQ